MIEILTNGPANAVQDAGRPGLLHLGISGGGAMDRLAFDIGNALLGNDPGAAAIEVAMFPFRLRIEADTRLAVTGADCAATLDGRPLPPNWAIEAPAGAELRLDTPRAGARAYVALAGGIDVAPVLGARATDLKTGFGGHAGRGLQRGDRLALGPAAPPALPPGGHGALPDADMAAFWSLGATRATLRVLPAAEWEGFTDAARATFTDADWQVTHEANRLGYRLEGPGLDMTDRPELLSHGLLPGTVQVPASGQPIVQLADANTCGGYPKIAVVIGADLWKIGQLGPGGILRFQVVTRDAALQAGRDRAAWLARLAAQSSR
ncbi:MAG: Allophanate hydrolase subunit 2 [Rhodobacteraceae bacterium HLUCCA08]|nr:MAG: Allophanate hydrolase subunit 2 [Rhodobacteraceae bacterium HLUCCA08]